LPVTASDEEQFLAIADEPSACRPQLSGAESAESRVASQTDEPSACRPELSAGQGVLPVSRKGLVVIHSRQFEMQQWLAAACRRRGYATVWSRSGRSTCVEGARAAIFDFTGGIDAEREDLRSLVERLRPAPVVALLNFPRVEDRDCLVAWGAAAVLSKPVLLADLFEQLNDLLNEPWDLS
jgi:CheY-like chemotaxis protein